MAHGRFGASPDLVQEQLGREDHRPSLVTTGERRGSGHPRPWQGGEIQGDLHLYTEWEGPQALQPAGQLAVDEGQHDGSADPPRQHLVVECGENGTRAGSWAGCHLTPFK